MEFLTQKKVIRINGHKVNVEVKVTVLEESADLLLDQDFENEEQKKEYVGKIESGRIFAGHITVEATALGLEGFDSLGSCELRANNMFDSKPYNDSVTSYLVDHGMIQNAVDALRKNIKEHATQLRNKAKKALAESKQFEKYEE